MRWSLPASPRRQSPRVTVAILWAAILVVPGLGGTVLAQMAGGLFGFGSTQSITGSSAWGGICPSDQQAGRCMWSSGFALVGPTGQILMSTTGAQLPEQSGYNHNYSLVFNSSSATSFSSLNLSCSAADPYYPGSGADFFIPCDPPNASSNAGSVVIVQISTDRVVGQIPLEGFYTSWLAPEGLAWDSDNGLLYACNSNLGVLLALNTTEDSTLFNVTMPGGCAWVIYDRSSNSLLVSGTFAFSVSGDGLNVVSPLTGQVRETLFPGRTNIGGGEVTAGVVNAADGWVALGIASSENAAVGSVILVNASTFAPISTISLTPGGESGFSVPYQILVDSSHGDLYSLSTGGMFAVNDTQDSVLAEMVVAPSPCDFSAIYLPSSDSVYLSSEGHIVTVSLTHSTSQELTELLWLPQSVAVLTIAGLSGAVVAVAVYLRRPNDSL